MHPRRHPYTKVVDRLATIGDFGAATSTSRAFYVKAPQKRVIEHTRKIRNRLVNRTRPGDFDQRQRPWVARGVVAPGAGAMAAERVKGESRTS